MKRHFTTTIDKDAKGYVLTSEDPGNLTVRVNIDLTSHQDDATTVLFENTEVPLAGAAFDDLSVRIVAARTWLIRSRGDLSRMEDFLGTI